jgi:uncharacterized protein YdeI (YjbR/CyaY-like superfamily)
MSTEHHSVDSFVSRAGHWRAEIRRLRAILLACGLDEAIKWGKPCYMFEGSNVAIIQPFKAHCALMSFKGALLQDTHQLLRSQGKNSRSALRLEFTRESEIEKTVVASYVMQAVEVAKSGREVAIEPGPALVLPDELKAAMKQDRELARAFNALTPGRQRGYVLHFAGAKQAQTRGARIAKCVPKILAGRGLNER